MNSPSSLPSVAIGNNLMQQCTAIIILGQYVNTTFNERYTFLKKNEYIRL